MGDRVGGLGPARPATVDGMRQLTEETEVLGKFALSICVGDNGVLTMALTQKTPGEEISQRLSSDASQTPGHASSYAATGHYQACSRRSRLINNLQGSKLPRRHHQMARYAHGLTTAASGLRYSAAQTPALATMAQRLL